MLLQAKLLSLHLVKCYVVLPGVWTSKKRVLVVLCTLKEEREVTVFTRKTDRRDYGVGVLLPSRWDWQIRLR